MKKPVINEKVLNKLLLCLVDEFVAAHGEIPHHLSNHPFYLTNRRGCAKKARLNYEYSVNTEEYGLETMQSSVYVQAVKELEHKNFVEFDRDRLCFMLTQTGYDFAKEKTDNVIPFWKKIEQFFLSKIGIITALGLGVAIFASFKD